MGADTPPHHVVASPSLRHNSQFQNGAISLCFLCSGRTTGGSHTVTSCRTGEVEASTQGWGLRAGTLISLPCTPTLEVILYREGEMFPAASLSTGSRSNRNLPHPCDVSLTCVRVRLGMVDPDLPPPGPPTLKSFKVKEGMLSAVLLS